MTVKYGMVKICKQRLKGTFKMIVSLKELLMTKEEWQEWQEYRSASKAFSELVNPPAGERYPKEEFYKRRVALGRAATALKRKERKGD